MKVNGHQILGFWLGWLQTRSIFDSLTNRYNRGLKIQREISRIGVLLSANACSGTN